MRPTAAFIVALAAVSPFANAASLQWDDRTAPVMPSYTKLDDRGANADSRGRRLPRFKPAGLGRHSYRMRTRPTTLNSRGGGGEHAHAHAVQKRTAFAFHRGEAAAATDPGSMLTYSMCGAMQATSPMQGDDMSTPSMYQQPAEFLGAGGNFTVPKISLRPGQKSYQQLDPALITYVGLDGIYCPEPLAAGVISFINANGTQENVAFYSIPGFNLEQQEKYSVLPGDQIAIAVQRLSADVVQIEWLNNSRKQRGQADPYFRIRNYLGAAMCARSASWAVEDITPGGLDPHYRFPKGTFFPAFDNVTFTAMVGLMTDNSRHFVKDATLTEMEVPAVAGQPGVVMCESKKVGDQSVVVKSV